MSLVVEVAGFGLSSSGAPVLVICVQQESFQAWTVYRRYTAFVSLAEQLQVLHPSVPPVPVFNPDDSSIATLDECRASMDTWLQSIAANPMILRTQYSTTKCVKKFSLRPTTLFLLLLLLLIIVHILHS